MSGWKDISGDAWSFTSNLIVGHGGGIGKYLTAYAVNEKMGLHLNGRISADLKIGTRYSTGAGLVCRANNLWTFLAFYIAPSNTQTDSTSMRIGVFQDGVFFPVVSSKEDVYLDDDFNRFTLEFFSGQIKGRIITSQKTYQIEYVVPHICFPGYVGLVKFYGASLRAKNIEFEDLSYQFTSGKNQISEGNLQGTNSVESSEFETQIPARLRKIFSDLVDKLVNIPPTSSFEGRSALLLNIPAKNSLNRSSSNARVDITLIVEQLWNREILFTTDHPLSIMIDNALQYVDGEETQIGRELMNLQKALEIAYQEV